MMIPVIRSRWIPLKKADFEEDKHPRKNDGKFAPKGEGESNGQESDSQKSETRNREETNKLTVKKPNGKAVSSGIKVKATGKLGKSVSHALTLIDKVHGDGELTHIPIEEMTANLSDIEKRMLEADPSYADFLKESLDETASGLPWSSPNHGRDRDDCTVKEMLPLLSDEELDYVYALYKDKYKGTMRKQ